MSLSFTPKQEEELTPRSFSIVDEFDIFKISDIMVDPKSHPYFGFTMRAQKDSRGVQLTNKQGFVTKTDLPCENLKGVLDIGFFGGSTINFLLSTNRSEGDVAKFIARYLPTKYKKIRVLNFALPAGSQPMQYNIFSYVAHCLDVAVNFDGSNELNVPKENMLSNVLFNYPNLYHLLFEVRLSFHEKVYEMLISRKIFSFLTKL